MEESDNDEVVISSFDEAFGPIAHHFFPDGAIPQEDVMTDGQDEESIGDLVDIASIWPVPKDRKAVSAEQVRLALPKLQLFAKHKGLCPSQLWAVTLCACATLLSYDNARRCTNIDVSTVVTGSPLVDGTSVTFRALIRCLIPSTIIPSIVPKRLLHAAAQESLDLTGKVFTLRFLTLVVRNSCQSSKDRHVLTAFYALVFHLMITDPLHLSSDAVRFLHAITRRRHVRVDRARRLRDCYNRLQFNSKQQEKNTKQSLHYRQQSSRTQHARASILLLLQLYGRYDPRGCSCFVPAVKIGPSILSRCFQILDRDWERDFSGEFHAESNSDGPPPTKRQKLLLSPSHKNISPNNRPSLTNSLDWLEHAFEGVHSFSKGQDDVGGRRVAVRASDLLLDESLRHLILLCADPSSRTTNDSTHVEVSRLRVCLPYMLHEEWYSWGGIAERNNREDHDIRDDSSRSENSDTDDDVDSEGSVKNRPSIESLPLTSSRNRVLCALASAASHVDVLFPELETFILEEILPSWNGNEPVAMCLCHDLLPALTPCNFTVLHTKVLQRLEPYCVYGSPKVQHCIVSGFLTKLIRRWGRLDWSVQYPRKKTPGNSTSNKSNDKDELNLRVLRALIQWTDKLIVKSFLVTGGNETLRVAACDFFNAAASLSTLLNEVPTPSPAIIYRLLLSRSALAIDRVCHVLVVFKNEFQKFKERETRDDKGQRDRVAIYNCYIWDFCSVLWRCSPLPFSPSTTENEMARTRSILFTDLPQHTLNILHETEGAAFSQSLTNSAAFIGYAHSFSPKIMKGKEKLKYLDNLNSISAMTGLFSFLTTFVHSLAEREKRKALKKNESRANVRF